MLKAALLKHSNHDQYFCAEEEYVLLYPDHKIVVKVPGSEEDFTVLKYKKELSKPFNRCDLFVCKLHDLSASVSGENITKEDEEDVTNDDSLDEFLKDSAFKRYGFLRAFSC